MISITRPLRYSSALILALLSGAGAGPGPVPPVSLVLITLDTARADHFGCYGYPRPTTRVLDRLAREGTLFADAFTSAVLTNPSHASLLTGLAPVAHGNRFNGTRLNGQVQTLATLLSRQGYRTGGFVSGFSMTARQTAFDRGFELYDDRFSGPERRAGETVGRAVAWLRSLPRGKPYFLFLHLYDPHGKYDPPQGFAERFRTGRYDPVRDPNRIPSYQRLQLPGGVASRDPLDYISRYDGEINYAAQEIGRILEAVGREPLIVFAADHGESLLEREVLFNHGTRLNEEQIRVPLIFRFPEPSLNGKHISEPVQLVDVAPTVLAYLGLPGIPGTNGRNLLPFLRTREIPQERVIFSEGRAAYLPTASGNVSFPSHVLMLSARTGRYKLIRYPTDPRPTFELFDLAKDPAEKRNIAGKEPERVSALSRLIAEYEAQGEPARPPQLDEEAIRKLRSLGYID